MFSSTITKQVILFVNKTNIDFVRQKRTIKKQKIYENMQKNTKIDIKLAKFTTILANYVIYFENSNKGDII